MKASVQAEYIEEEFDQINSVELESEMMRGVNESEDTKNDIDISSTGAIKFDI